MAASPIYFQRGGLQVEYAKTSRSSCKACGKTISQGSLRIGQETKSEYHDGYDLGWFHLNCCLKGSGPRVASINQLKHWYFLRYKDQIDLRKKLGEAIPTGTDEDRAKEENERWWVMIDELDNNTKTAELKTLLEANGIDVDKKMSGDVVLQRAADGLVFGRIGNCPQCKTNGLIYAIGREYYCKGWATSYTRCEWVGRAGVERFKFVVPANLKKNNSFFKDFEYPADHPRIEFGKAAPADTTTTTTSSASDDPPASASAASSEEGEINESAIIEEEVPVGLELYGVVVVFAGGTKDFGGRTQDELEEIVERHGGSVANQIEDDVTVVVTSESEASKRTKTKKVQAAIKKHLPMVKVEWLDNLTQRKEEGIALRHDAEAIKKYFVGKAASEDGYVDIAKTPIVGRKYTKARYEREQQQKEEADKMDVDVEKIEEKPATEATKGVKRKRERAPCPGSDILKVDPDVGRGEILVTNDAEHGYTAYNVMLNLADIGTGANKFYKMQIIRSGKSYTFFIKWGRIGTDVGGQREYAYKSESAAIEAFADKFKQMTGNDWENRGNFEKKGGKYFMVELDDGNEEDSGEPLLKRPRVMGPGDGSDEKPSTGCIGSSLNPRLQRLISMLFDQDTMKKTLVSMEVDLKKMPLGKISKSQIRKGYEVLTEISALLEAKEKPPNFKMQLADCSNRFYTLIPHDFGAMAPPLIDNVEVVRKKASLLETLVDIEIATSLMKESDKSDAEHPLDSRYKSLKTTLVPLDKDSERYRLIEKYAIEGHDRAQFGRFTFAVEDIFEVVREGEAERFEPWKNNHNRALLWHGSRLTNWVGILSQGLRIAPPEAPKTGYRFGKGVYFADTVSKSASYCFTTPAAPDACMILAEVALGNPYEVLVDEYMEKAPPGKDSTKALGRTAPDPKEDVIVDNNIRVPCGKPVPTGIKSACTHNEYIVYSVAQIKIRYMLKVRFFHH